MNQIESGMSMGYKSCYRLTQAVGDLVLFNTALLYRLDLALNGDLKQLAQP